MRREKRGEKKREKEKDPETTEPHQFLSIKDFVI